MAINQKKVKIKLSLLILLGISLQFSSVAQSCLTLCDPMNRSTPGLPVHHQVLESTQTHVHRVGNAIQPSHPLSSPSPPAPNPSQHQSLFSAKHFQHPLSVCLSLPFSLLPSVSPDATGSESLEEIREELAMCQVWRNPRVSGEGPTSLC